MQARTYKKSYFGGTHWELIFQATRDDGASGFALAKVISY